MERLGTTREKGMRMNSRALNGSRHAAQCEMILGVVNRRRCCNRAYRDGLCKLHWDAEDRAHRLWLAESQTARARGHQYFVGKVFRTGQPRAVRIGCVPVIPSKRTQGRQT